MFLVSFLQLRVDPRGAVPLYSILDASNAIDDVLFALPRQRES